MEIQKFKEVSQSVYENIQSLTPEGIKLLGEILRLKRIKYGRISRYGVEESNVIILLTLKQNCLILLKFLIDNKIELPCELIDDAIDLLICSGCDGDGCVGMVLSGRTGVCSEVSGWMEIERIVGRIVMSVIDIIYANGRWNEKLVRFLEAKNAPDNISVNLAPIVECAYKSFELKVLSRVEVGPVLLSLVESFRDKLRPVARDRIIQSLKKYFTSKFSTENDDDDADVKFYNQDTKKNNNLNIKKNTDKHNSKNFDFKYDSSGIFNSNDGITVIGDDKRNTSTAELNLIYKIFYLINGMKDMDILQNTEVEATPEFIGLMCSLIVDRESADGVYEKMCGVFTEFERALSVLAEESRNSLKKVQKRDEAIIEKCLECIGRLLRWRRMNFYRFVPLLQVVLKVNVGRRTKGLIYEILSEFVGDTNLFIEKTVVPRKDIEEEIFNRDFFLLPRLVKFINAYFKREQNERELLSSGKILCGYMNDGIINMKRNGYNNDNNIENNYYSKTTIDNELVPRELEYEETYADIYGWALRSEDPDTVIACLDGIAELNEYLKNKDGDLRGNNRCKNVLLENVAHLRNAMVKDMRVCKKVLHYQLITGMLIRSVSIINIILGMPSNEFFTYAGMFDDFSPYLNGDVLDHISDSPYDGIEWLRTHYCVNTGRWVVKNATYFNDLLRSDAKLQIAILPLYEKILDDNIGKVEVLIDGTTDHAAARVFLISGCKDFVTLEFFRIFAKQLIYAKFYGYNNVERFILKEKYATEGFVLYLKAKIVAGFSIEKDIVFMQDNFMDTDEIIGYLSIVAGFNGFSYNKNEIEKENCNNEEKSINTNYNKIKCKSNGINTLNKQFSKKLLVNFGIKDSAYFLKNFRNASDFEKFVLFFSLDTVNKEIDTIIKEEIMANVTGKNKIYLRMCVLQLFKCSNLDSILRILEKTFTDKILLFKLNIYNIATGGRYCSKTLINQVNTSLKARAIFFLYHFNIWDKDYLIELINRLEPVDNEIMYLKKLIKAPK